MNKEKLEIRLIILGNLLYISYIFFCNTEKSSLGNFTSGVLLGLSIGINLIGIILIVMCFSKNKK